MHENLFTFVAMHAAVSTTESPVTAIRTQGKEGEEKRNKNRKNKKIQTTRLNHH